MMDAFNDDTLVSLEDSQKDMFNVENLDNVGTLSVPLKGNRSD